MPEKRTSAWLRETLCDEIESVRSGKSDHIRAKSVALLSRELLKSVEVEIAFRQQQCDLRGQGESRLGELPLCGEEPRELNPVSTLPRVVHGKSQSGSR